MAALQLVPPMDKDLSLQGPTGPDARRQGTLSQDFVLPHHQTCFMQVHRLFSITPDSKIIAHACRPLNHLDFIVTIDNTKGSRIDVMSIAWIPWRRTPPLRTISHTCIISKFMSTHADPSQMEQSPYISTIDAEPLYRYRRGGYHPVTLGECLKSGRYKVLHKLGWGGYSTVWAARDQTFYPNCHLQGSRQLQGCRFIENRPMLLSKYRLRKQEPGRCESSISCKTWHLNTLIRNITYGTHA
jgi:hypothetical protein